ncbi:MAG: DUF6702 family protein [Salibacteraceae bacterium]
MKQLFLFSFIAVIFGFTPPHPQHVSIMQIDHNTETKSLEVTLKSFVDDIELAIKNQKNEKVFLGQVKPKSEEYSWVENYIKSQLQFSVDEKSKEINWVGWEITNDEIFMYFEIPVSKTIKSIEIKNEVLMKEFADQTNIVHLKYQGQNKSLFLQRETSTKSFQLKN